MAYYVYQHVIILMNTKIVNYLGTLSGGKIICLGTMSGGGNKVIKGKMGSSLVERVDPKELQTMEKELEKVYFKLIVYLKVPSFK